MRIQLSFSMKAIPISYRLGTLSIIKEIIKNGSLDYYEKLFEKNKREMKPFSYSCFIRNLDIKNNQINGEELTLTISSSSYEFILHLMNGCNRADVYYISDSTLTLKSKRLLPKTNISKGNVIFKTPSMLIENKFGKPLLATDEAFEKEFQYTANLILEKLYQRTPKQPIQVLQTLMTKMVMKENLHQTQDKPLYLTANKGLIQLQGNAEDLQYLYDSGVSMRRSLGFGLLELVEEVN
ncbi:CRISPR-associated endoribonuclease Cas6 [Virgibacillus oceani]